MAAKVLQMGPARTTVANFLRTVGTIERKVNFTVGVVADEDGSCRLCQIDLLNPGPHGGLCRALLAPAHVDELIGALTAWKTLPCSRPPESPSTHSGTESTH